MRKTALLLLSLLLVSACASGVRKESGSLSFGENGELRILQLTDLHFKPLVEADKVFECIDIVVAEAQPDLIVLTGDNIYAAPAEISLRTLLKKIDSFNVPFCLVWGNHDEQFDLKKDALYDIACSYGNCIMPPRGKKASGDYEVEVLGSAGARAALLYFFDSNGHLYSEDGEFLCYDAIHEDQVEAYRSRSGEYTARNGGVPYPAVAFFHIPLPEYGYAINEGVEYEGIRQEAECAPPFNTGLFQAFKDCGDVFAVFVGHDHDNDYTVMYDGMLLGYGRFSGSNTEYNHIANGGRVIVLKEGERKVDTWIVKAGTNGK